MELILKTGVVITNTLNRRVLLIREQYQDSFSSGRWNIIKGTYDQTDDCVISAAARECLEEASVVVRLTHALGVYLKHGRDGKIRIQFNFIGQIVHGLPTVPDPVLQHHRRENIIDLRWFSKDEVLSMKPNQFISYRAYIALSSWATGVSYPLDTYKTFYADSIGKEHLAQ